MSKPGPRPRYELVENELLARAADLFAERGYNGTSLQDIADTMGMTRPAIYHYFENKDALLVALGELPERERAIVSLRYGAELNASEIAVSLGIEPATARKILERTRARLGERIEALLRPVGGMS